MNKSYFGETIRVPIRLETSAGVNITSITQSMLVVSFAFATDAAFDVLATPSEFTLEELSIGQYWLLINASLNTKMENYQVVVDGSACCASIVTKRYSGTVIAKNFSDGAVHYNGASGITVEDYPSGIRTRPVDNFQAMRNIASTNKLSTVKIDLGGADREDTGFLTDIKVIGHNSNKNYQEVLKITQLVMNAEFNDLRITQPSEDIRGCQFNRCVFIIRFLGEQNYFNASDFEGAWDVNCRQSAATAPAPDLFTRCNFAQGMAITLENGGSTGKHVYVSKCTGNLIIKGVAHVNRKIYIDGFDGDIDIDSSCTAGAIIIRGLNGRLAGTMTIVTQYGTKFDVSNKNLIQSSIKAVGEISVATIGEFRADVSALALDATVAKDATVSKAAGAKGTDDIHDTMALEATLAGIGSTVDLIQAKTTNLPADPASQALIAGNVWNAIKTSFIVSNSFGEVMMELASGAYNKWRVFRDAGDSNKHKAQLYTWAGAAHKKALLRDKNAAVITELFEDDKPYQRDAAI